MAELIVRATPLLDLEVKRDGRTVVAYAASFDEEYEVTDAHGHYLERNSARSFDKSIREKGTRFGVFYNHGMSLHGTPLSDLGSVPLGTPKVVRAEKRGLLTETLYGENPFADAVLQAIRDGSVQAYSHTSAAIKSSPAGRVPRVTRGGPLPVVTRLELGLREFGPTPLPVNAGAEITAVRSSALLSNTDRATLLYELLTSTTPTGLAGEPETSATPDGGAGDRGAAHGHSTRDRSLLIARAVGRLGTIGEAVGEVQG